MRLAAAVIASFVLVCQAALAAAQTIPASFTAVEVRVHGNHTTPEADVLTLAAIPVGSPITTADIDAATERLTRSSHFDDVEVRVRSRSISDPSQVAIVIVVTERPGVTPDLLIDHAPSPLRRLRGATMFMPILDYEDGYGLSYGMRVSFVDPVGGQSRLSIPATWGGNKRIGAELEKSFGAAMRTSARASATLSRREHPFYETDEDRVELQASLRQRVGVASVAALGGWSNVTLGAFEDRYTSLGLEADVDTRTDPTFPRNAMYLRGRVRWFDFSSLTSVAPSGADAPRLRRSEFLAQGFIGFVRSSVIAVSGRYETANATLPPYLTSILGGVGSVRGFRVGTDVGDKLWAASAELRVPLSDSTRLGRVGLRAFVDTGGVATWDQPIKDATRLTGYGAGAFTQASLLQLGIDVARGHDSGWRVHVMSGVRF